MERTHGARDCKECSYCKATSDVKADLPRPPRSPCADPRLRAFASLCFPEAEMLTRTFCGFLFPGSGYVHAASSTLGFASESPQCLERDRYPRLLKFFPSKREKWFSPHENDSGRTMSGLDGGGNCFKKQHKAAHIMYLPGLFRSCLDGAHEALRRECCFFTAHV